MNVVEEVNDLVVLVESHFTNSGNNSESGPGYTSEESRISDSESFFQNSSLVSILSNASLELNPFRIFTANFSDYATTGLVSRPPTQELIPYHAKVEIKEGGARVSAQASDQAVVGFLRRALKVGYGNSFGNNVKSHNHDLLTTLLPLCHTSALCVDAIFDHIEDSEDSLANISEVYSSHIHKLFIKWL